jgi:predicted mannosyl-3-phosphoglycerate phosphatase (HAD superfamily)
MEQTPHRSRVGQVVVDLHSLPGFGDVYGDRPLLEVREYAVFAARMRMAAVNPCTSRNHTERYPKTAPAT